ncbi:MAG: ribonuclease D [Thermoflexales bacterium]|nr:ribonuclease D [Thermoflexales bacterium]
MMQSSVTKRVEPLAPPTLITRQASLDEMLARLLDEPAVAVDTESDSMYVYREKVCLVQFSIPTCDYLLDPLSGLDMAPLGSLFADPRVEKVFHAAEYDVLCLKRDEGFEFRNLFDTMWAARVLGWPRLGLASILEERFGVSLNKRWQRYNWGKRPLVPGALAYARLDTHFLLDIRAMQLAALQAAGRLEEAREIFDQQAELAPPDVPDPHSFWRVKGVWDLTGREQALVRELHAYREHEASRRDQPVFYIFSDKTLVNLAQAQPHCLQELFSIDGLKSLHVKRYGPGILEALARGQEASIPRPPYSPRPDEHILERYETLRAWRNDLAHQRGVEPDVIMSNATLMDIAQRCPTTLAELEDIEGLGPWRRKTYGPQVLGVIRKT